MFLNRHKSNRGYIILCGQYNGENMDKSTNTTSEFTPSSGEIVRAWRAPQHHSLPACPPNNAPPCSSCSCSFVSKIVLENNAYDVSHGNTRITHLVEEVKRLVIFAGLYQVSTLPLHPAASRLKLVGQLLPDRLVRGREALVAKIIEAIIV